MVIGLVRCHLLYSYNYVRVPLNIGKPQHYYYHGNRMMVVMVMTIATVYNNLKLTGFVNNKLMTCPHSNHHNYPMV